MSFNIRHFVYRNISIKIHLRHKGRPAFQILKAYTDVTFDFQYEEFCVKFINRQRSYTVFSLMSDAGHPLKFFVLGEEALLKGGSHQRKQGKSLFEIEFINRQRSYTVFSLMSDGGHPLKFVFPRRGSALKRGQSSEKTGQKSI